MIIEALMPRNQAAVAPKGALIEGLGATVGFFTEAVCGTLYMAQYVAAYIPGSRGSKEGVARVSPEAPNVPLGGGPEARG